MTQCVFCNTTDNLNTQFTITVNDAKVVVQICDAHAEEATVKSAKEAYLRKDEQIKALLEQAKALGLDIAPTKSGLLIASSPDRTPTPADVQRSTIATPSFTMDVNDPNVVPTDRVDRRSDQSSASIGGSQNGISVESNTSYNLGNLLPEEVRKGYAKMGTVEGRNGQQLAIPVERVDGTGSTRIRVRKSDDTALQKRFKQMAANSMNDNVPDFARSGYQNTMRTCPLCTGKMVINGKDCPKCGGTGEIVL